jgi:hypothetical protein
LVSQWIRSPHTVVSAASICHNRLIPARLSTACNHPRRARKSSSRHLALTANNKQAHLSSRRSTSTYTHSPHPHGFPSSQEAPLRGARAILSWTPRRAPAQHTTACRRAIDQPTPPNEQIFRPCLHWGHQRQSETDESAIRPPLSNLCAACDHHLPAGCELRSRGDLLRQQEFPFQKS